MDLFGIPLCGHGAFISLVLFSVYYRVVLFKMELTFLKAHAHVKREQGMNRRELVQPILLLFLFFSLQKRWFCFPSSSMQYIPEDGFAWPLYFLLRNKMFRYNPKMSCDVSFFHFRGHSLKWTTQIDLHKEWCVQDFYMLSMLWLLVPFLATFVFLFLCLSAYRSSVSHLVLPYVCPCPCSTLVQWFSIVLFAALYKKVLTVN